MTAALTRSSPISRPEPCECGLRKVHSEPQGCARCGGDAGVAPPITLPHPTAGSGPASSPAWTLDHLTQVGFGLGLGLDIACHATSDHPGNPTWTMTWNTAGAAITAPTSDNATDFAQAIRSAAARLNAAPNTLYSRGELIPVPRQSLPPIVGVRRAESILTSLAQQGTHDAVLCRITPGECSISLCSGRYVEPVSSGADLESAAAGIGL